jgi:LAO/AO transport system kinase
VNKADGDNRARAEAARREFSRALHYLSGPEGSWRQTVLACSAATGEGIPEVWETVEKFFSHGKRSGEFAERRREQVLAWLGALLDEGLREAYASRRGVAALRAELESQVGAGLLPAPEAARRLLAAAGFAQ